MENERLIITPQIGYGYYLSRNIWAFLTGIVMIIFLLIVKVLARFGMEELVDFTDKVVNILILIVIIASIIIYLRKTIKMVLDTRKLKCTFYETYVKFEDNFLNVHSKEIKYKDISEVSMEQYVWDRFLNTGTIHLKTPVEREVGIHMSYIVNPKQVVSMIRDIINSSGCNCGKD